MQSVVLTELNPRRRGALVIALNERCRASSVVTRGGRCVAELRRVLPLLNLSGASSFADSLKRRSQSRARSGPLVWVNVCDGSLTGSHPFTRYV